MLLDTPLTRHFWLSQFIVTPSAARCGQSNLPLSSHLDNLRRLAQTLELARAHLLHAHIYILGAYQRSTAAPSDAAYAASRGRSVDFVAPGFGTPRDVCAHLVAQGLVFDGLTNCGDWVTLQIPEFGAEPRRQLLTGAFSPGVPMRNLEGLV